MERSRRQRKAILLMALIPALTGLMLALSANASASPTAPNVVKTFTQPDGTTLQLRQWGDEFAHGWETTDGYTVVLDKQDRVWKYAERDQRGRLKPSKDVVRKGTPKAGKRLRPSHQAYQAERERLGAPVADAAPAWSGADTDVLFLMVEFSDVGCSFTPTQMQANMFGATATGPGNLAEYYDEISYGQLGLQGTVVGNNGNTDCITLSNTKAYYDTVSSNADGDDELVKEALGIANAYVDFANYDNDNDGTVDALGIIYAGGGAHDGCYTSTNDNNLWPHSGGLADNGTFSGDGKTINPFIINSEVTHPAANNTCNVIQTIGLFAHELGHSLGLPDLYDTDVGNGGVDVWSLMASQYLSTTNLADTPPHMDPWSKWFLGWVTPVGHAPGDRFVESISRVEDSGEVHRFRDNPSGVEVGGSGEYFLVENRQQTMFDAQLPGCGIVVWHIDEAKSDNTQGGHTNATHRLVDIDEADGLAELDNNTAADAGDPFPGSTNNLLFAGSTNPSSNLYDGTGSGVRMRMLTTSCSNSMSAAFGPNSPPTADAGGPYSTIEGTDKQLDGTASSDPDNDTLTYAWDLDNDGQYDDSTSAQPMYALVGQDGVYTVGLRVTDAFGESDTDTATVTVTNVAPVVSIGAVQSRPENTSVSVSGSVSDPGWLDPLSATIDWGDGGGAVPLGGTLENVRPNATLSFSAQHIYGDDGSFTVTICAADDDTTNNCASVAVTVTNVVPTATISEAGTVVINGVPVFITQAGATLSLSGRSTDPGSDDLTLTWLWDDGSPPTSTLYLNDPALNPDPDPSPTINPRDVTNTASHAFAACLYDVGFRATDDDAGVSSTDTVKVLVTGTSALRFSAGYWQNIFRERKSSPFTDAQLDCYLEIVRFVSLVFSETRSANTIQQANNVLKVGNSTAPKDQFDRQLLAALINFANGEPDYNELIDTDGNGVGDTEFLAVIAAAEAVRNNPASTNADIIAQKNLLERINLTTA